MNDEQIEKIIGHGDHFYDKTPKKVVIETNIMHIYNWNELDTFRVENGIIKFSKVPDDIMNDYQEEIYLNVEDIKSIKILYK